MPSFEFTPYSSPFANSIAELMLRRGDTAARAAEQIGAAQARAQEQIGAAQAQGAQQSGQAWARGLEGAGQAVSGAIQQATDPARKMEALKLREAQTGIAEHDTFKKILKDTPPVNENGMKLYDLSALASKATAVGLDPSPYLEHYANVNTGFRNEYQARMATVQAGAKGLMLAPDPALAQDFLTRLKENHTISSEVYDHLSHLIDTDPTPQNILRIATPFAGEQKPIMGAPGATPLSPITGQPMGPTLPDKPTKAGLAATANDPKKTPEERAQAAAALASMQTPAKRTEAELALDAFAKSIGKTKAEDLTDADRQAFVKRDAQNKADIAFGQHQREHAYDVAHPAPVKGKSQDELEQEARGVLQREFSSRSGGLGTEDAKVNQAVHLLTLMNQFDGKPMPAQIHGELALGLARLTSPNGQVGIELEREFKQKTAAEGLSKAVAYLTGDPTLVNATPEKLREMLRDSITRQGHVAEENRGTYLNAMLSMLPTQLDASRREALQKSVELNKVDTVKMRAPNGQIQDVPRKDIEHYKARGAKVIGG